MWPFIDRAADCDSRRDSACKCASAATSQAIGEERHDEGPFMDRAADCNRGQTPRLGLQMLPAAPAKRLKRSVKAMVVDEPAGLQPPRLGLQMRGLRVMWPRG